MQQVYDKDQQKDGLSPKELDEAEQGAHDKTGLTPEEVHKLDQLEGSPASGETAQKPKAKGDDDSGDDQVGKGYTGKGEGGGDKKKKGRVIAFGKKKKRGLIFGGVLGVGAVGGFTILSTTFAPLQFIHISQALSTQLATQQDTDDESVLRLFRYIRHLTKGTPERTRLSFLKNKYADRFEARLQSVGLTSTYTNIYGFINGYAIDRSHPEFKNMNDQQLKQYVKETYNLDLVEGSTLSSSPEARGKMIVQAKDLSYFSKGRKLLRIKMSQAGVGKIGSAIGLRLLVIRSGAGFHPMTLRGLDTEVLRSTEDLFNKMRERRIARIKNGTNVVPKPESRSGGDSEEERVKAQNAEAAKASADATLAEGAAADAEVKAGKPGALVTFQNSLTLKLVGGGAAAVSVPCLLRAIATENGEIKRAQVFQPGERIGTEFMALGSQNEASMDFEGPQLGFYERMLVGKDSRGNVSSFSDAQGWNALEGNGKPPYKGVPPDETLTKAGSGTPFDYLNQGGTGATLDVVCSTAVQLGLTAVTFLGGPISAAVGIAAAMVAVGPLVSQAAHWLSGNALNVEAVGADLGNIMPFGALWAGNEQGLASGGAALTALQAQNIRSASSSGMREEFNDKSLAYRLFNPRDYRTPVAKLIDKQSTQNVAQNVASGLRSFTNVGSSLVENFSSILFGRAGAQAAPYDWGVPLVGKSIEEMNDARFQNPYESSERTARTLLEGPNAQSLIDRAVKCNAVTISRDTEGHWNATSIPNKSPAYKDIQTPECMDTGYEWTSVQFFIGYTVSMNAQACREGDQESCENTGMGNNGTVQTTSAIPIEGGGDPKALAQQIWAKYKSPQKQITFQTAAGARAFEQVVATGAQQACGRSIPISPTLLAVILKASETYKIVLGVFAEGHGCDSGFHPRGMAVDINGVAKGAVTTGNFFHLNEMNASQMALAKEFYEALSNTFPEGYGGLGQIQCFSPPPPNKKPTVLYFNDSCDHLHMDVRRNK